MRFRKVIFWMHLVAGIISGLSIGIMCFTGTAIAFEKQIIAWAERDVRRVAPPAPDAPRLPIDELMTRVRATQPDARPASIVVSSDPRAAVAFTVGRDGGFYANPYTGDIAQGSAAKTRAFMQSMTAWHRTLALTGENRNLGKYINGACNVAFCVLAASGLYLWWPRSWSRHAFKAITLFNFKARGKARDFNWHNVIGLWSAPVLIVLTATAFPISYQWGGAFINYVTGTPATPAPGAGGGGGPGSFAAAPAVEVPRPAEGSRPLGYDALVAAVQKETPRWELITLRLTNAGPGGAGGRGSSPVASRPEGARAESTTTESPPSGGGRGGQRGQRGRGGEGAATGAAGEGRRGMRPASGEGRSGNREALANAVDGGQSAQGRGLAQAVSFTIRESGTWPRTASTTLTLDPYTGAVLRHEGFGDLALGRQVRSWTRFLHTGEALGTGGQIVAGLASLGGCFLVWTGFALAWRRFFGRRSPKPAAATT